MNVAAETRRELLNKKVRRLDPAAIVGVMSRDINLFRKFWKATTFSSIVEPTIYLLAFGFGFGGLVASVNGVDYIEYVGTGVVASAALFSSVFAGMFNTFIRREFQRTYDALLAAPVSVEELVTAEVLWISCRAGIYCMAPLFVAIAFGLDPLWGIMLVPFVGFITGWGFASFGVLISAMAKSIDNFNYVTSAIITPLFLLAGTFFPINELPPAIEWLAQFNPLYHCVQLVRDLVIFGLGWIDLVHLAALLLFAVVMWRLAIWRQTKQLID
ncbi:MAG: ABC transporter permease [Solirubrobacterales bacterium]|nr:ABC transporter permease [Solirubrobacterales bacterium]